MVGSTSCIGQWSGVPCEILVRVTSALQLERESLWSRSRLEGTNILTQKSLTGTGLAFKLGRSGL